MTTLSDDVVISSSPDETVECARLLAASLDGPCVIALHGDLGAGKTCFVRGLALALGIETTITSPTFTLINEYTGPRPLYHVDLYRVSSDDDLTTIGMEELLETEGVIAIEWAERGTALLPPDTIHVELRVLPDPDHREIRIIRPA